jgi:hypothetical protein
MPASCVAIQPSRDVFSAVKIPAIPPLSILIGEIAQILRQALADSPMGSSPPVVDRITKAQKDGIMRFYEGDHAYEIEPVRDPATQLCKGWRYNVYRIRPDHQLLRSGEAPTQQEAESAGRKALASLTRREVSTDADRGHAA